MSAQRPPDRDEAADALADVTAADLRQLLDQLPAVIGLLDGSHRHRFINQAGARLTGRAASDILGRTNAEVGWEADDIENRPPAEAALAGDPAHVEGWHRSKSGRLRFVQRDFYPNRDADGAVDGYWGVARDATELKLAEARAGAMVTAALDAIVAIDTDGIILEFNPAAERIFGLTRAQAMGRPMADLLVPPGLRAAHLAGFRRYLETHEARLIGRRVEVGALRADGSEFPCELAIAEINVAERRTFIAYLRDLTASRAAEAEIRRQREALLEREKMATYGLLLAGIAHELNNPLALVLGHAQMLREMEPDGPHGARAAKIEEAAERCARIVRSFLAMAREQPAQRQRLNLADVVHAALEQVGEELASLDVQLDIASVGVAVEGDPDQLRQVAVNILRNAAQALSATPEPRLWIRLQAADDRVELTVRDNGPGVAPHLRLRIFDPFVTTKSPGSGSGIGLAVSRGLVEAHGGTLTLETPPQGGAGFRLHLPRAEP